MVKERGKEWVMKHVSRYYDCYEIGKIKQGGQKIEFVNRGMCE